MKVREPLSPEQQALAESAREWVWQEVNRVWTSLRLREGRDVLEQEAMLAACESARCFDPVANPGVPFGAYCRNHVRHRPWRATHLLQRNLHVRRTMPTDADGEQFLEPADTRRDERDPRLRLWCSEDARQQRRALNWHYRLILCLRYVESLTLEEVGEVYGITRERVRQLEEKAVMMLARARNRDRIARQLAGRFD